MSQPPSAGRRTPVSTYRLQLTPDFGFGPAAELLPYLDSLGVTDLYLSPVLQAAPDSQHGYDVVDHSRIRAEFGGREGLETLAAAAHARDMGLVVDIVPNHMTAPVPAFLNPAWWSFLRDGPDSPYRHWFDADLPTLVPVLGAPVDEVLASGELELTHEVVPGEERRGAQPVLRYHEHVLPVREGTEHLALPDLLVAQHHRPAWWRVGDEELSYRRFFDVTTLVGLRMEDERVFEATHALLFELFDAGVIDGFRVDHPDGMADPREYFRRLHDRTGGAWVVAEKILEGEEHLPEDWPVAGTTGYDLAWRLHGLQVDPAGAEPLAALARDLGATTEAVPVLAERAKREIIDGSLRAELTRLTSAVRAVLSENGQRDHTTSAVRACLIELLVTFPRYRAYVVPGEPIPTESREIIGACADRARECVSEVHRPTLDAVLAVILGDGLDSPAAGEAIIRFQQVCGALTAKGVEDTSFYRWTTLTSLCEVGAAPERFGVDIEEVHAWARRTTATHPATMTAGSTHDTKRGEDVRARLSVLAGDAEAWVALIRRLRGDDRPASLDGAAENLLWQTLVGTWGPSGPIELERIHDYLRKAVREQKSWTTWTSPDEAAEQDLFRYASDLLSDPRVRAELSAWHAEHAQDIRRAVLSTKLAQLTMPGVADIYRGTEVVETALVDPDNRLPVDFAALATALSEVDAEQEPAGWSALDLEKLRLTAAALRLRRRHAAAFVGPASTYLPLPSSSGTLLAYARGDAGGPQAVVLATRLRAPEPDASVVLPDGPWRNLLRPGSAPWQGNVTVGEVLDASPVALLEKDAT
ncbi:malto-oligosyltrehalose synthase [Bogoriella caseilytica]|uniref:Maltooligosyl trehalose synthase n=1 Tax=Bogoriella caseilytica TaxID=56055 RepID=A0A3N2BGB2_9MICO|nr:malto-oligosyltrehalose synthase [Bogoriella caseilytica]ROR74301.1 maltooligosyl trehalose synthase [Bogoriella caseilytica]